MGREVAGTLTVGFRGRTGLAEIFDEFLAFSQLLFFQSQHRTDAFQGKRQSHCGSPDHGAFPRVRSKVLSGGIAKIPGKTDAFKAGVERPLRNGIVLQGGENVCRNLLSAGQIDQLDGTTVRTIGEKQYFKYGRLHIAIYAGFCKWLIAVSLDIN